MNNSWIKWAVGEGISKTISKLLIKIIGVASKNLPGTFLATLVIGIIQMLSGVVGSSVRKKQLRAPATQIAGSMAFGAVATIMTVISFMTFTYEGADIGVVTFIGGMSIIPGAFVDWIFFGDKLRIRQWCGIAVFLIAGYAILNFPSLAEFLNLSTWVWLAISLPFFAVLNEAITRKIRKADPFVNNFWVGSSTILCCVLSLSVLGGWAYVGSLSTGFWTAAILISLVVVVMIPFKLLSYKDGSSIAAKKLVMWSVYIGAATMLGVIIYNEPLTIGKVLSLPGFLIAFTLTDQSTWEGVVKMANQNKTKKTLL